MGLNYMNSEIRACLKDSSKYIIPYDLDQQLLAVLQDPNFSKEKLLEINKRMSQDYIRWQSRHLKLSEQNQSKSKT